MSALSLSNKETNYILNPFNFYKFTKKEKKCSSLIEESIKSLFIKTIIANLKENKVFQKKAPQAYQLQFTTISILSQMYQDHTITLDLKKVSKEGLSTIMVCFVVAQLLNLKVNIKDEKKAAIQIKEITKQVNQLTDNVQSPCKKIGSSIINSYKKSYYNLTGKKIDNVKKDMELNIPQSILQIFQNNVESSQAEVEEDIKNHINQLIIPSKNDIEQVDINEEAKEDKHEE